MPDTQETKGTQLLETGSVFAYLNTDRNAAIALQVAEVDRTTQAIRNLEEITRQLDTPYIGSFFST